MAWNRVTPINLSLVVFSSVVKRIVRHEYTVIFDMSMGLQIVWAPITLSTPIVPVRQSKFNFAFYVLPFIVVYGTGLLI